MSDKSASREILLLWSAYRRDGKLPEGELKRFRTRFAPYFAEFVAAEHPADEHYLRDIESERPTEAAQARELKETGVPAVHFYTMGRTDNIRKIAKAVF